MNTSDRDRERTKLRVVAIERWGMELKIIASCHPPCPFTPSTCNEIKSAIKGVETGSSGAIVELLSSNIAGHFVSINDFYVAFSIS